MTEFVSWKSYWEFSNRIRCDYRYIHDKTVEQFFMAISETCEEKKIILNKGTVLWRAQLGHDWEDPNEKNNYKNTPCPFPASRMKPLINGAAEGRINPKGIPYLY